MDDPRFALLSLLMSELGGTYATAANAGGHYVLSLQLPQTLPS